MEVLRFLVLLAVLLCVRISYGAELHAPIYAANQNPFVRIYGLPKFESGRAMPQGRFELSAMYYVSSNAISMESGNSSLIWDAEIGEYIIRGRYGLFKRLEVGLEISMVDIDGGYTDSLIRHTHQLWGMPNDRQNAFDKNDLNLKYVENGVTLYETEDRSTGLGDIRLTAAVPIMGCETGAPRSLALRSVLKIPTGSSGRLMGSGAVDCSAGLTFIDLKTLGRFNLFYALQGGGLFPGKSDLFGDYQEDAVGYAGAMLGWQVFSAFALKVQYDYHTPFYASSLDQLGSSIQMTTGGTVELPGGLLVDAGMSQNQFTDATPDFGFYLMLRHLF